MAANADTRLPIFPLSTVLYPGATLTLHLFEPRYLKMMTDHGDDDPIFGVVLTREGREVGDEPETFDIGTAASLEVRAEHPDGRFTIIVVGGRRFRVQTSDWSSSYMTADIVWLPETEASQAAPALARQAKRRFKAYVQDVASQIGDDEAAAALAIAVDEAISIDPTVGPFQIAAQLPLNTWQRQRLLEIDDLDTRLQTILDLLRQERRRLATTGPSAAPSDMPSAGFSVN